MKHRLSIVTGLICLLTLGVGVRVAQAEPITVPNASFEAPDASVSPFFALSEVAEWTKAGPYRQQPDVGQEGLLDTGVFYNQPPGSGLHITGGDGDQLAFIGAQDPTRIPEGADPIALYQQLAAVYQQDQVYELTIAIGPASSLAARDPRTDNPNDPDPDAPPAELAFRLYYEAGGERLDVAAATVLSSEIEQNQVIDFALTSPVVQAEAPWVGQPIGIDIAPERGLSGYWNIDDVRLTAVPEPANFALLGLLGLALLSGRNRSGG